MDTTPWPKSHTCSGTWLNTDGIYCSVDFQGESHGWWIEIGSGSYGPIICCPFCGEKLP